MEGTGRSGGGREAERDVQESIPGSPPNLPQRPTLTSPYPTLHQRHMSTLTSCTRAHIFIHTPVYTLIRTYSYTQLYTLSCPRSHLHMCTEPRLYTPICVCTLIHQRQGQRAVPLSLGHVLPAPGNRALPAGIPWPAGPLKALGPEAAAQCLAPTLCLTLSEPTSCSWWARPAQSWTQYGPSAPRLRLLVGVSQHSSLLTLQESV